MSIGGIPQIGSWGKWMVTVNNHVYSSFISRLSFFTTEYVDYHDRGMFAMDSKADARGTAWIDVVGFTVVRLMGIG
jgi:hypothetical protein